MLVVRDLVVDYDRSPALRSVSLEVNEGEIVGLIGPNGAGKSTALATIMGRLKPTSGEISLRGASLLREKTEDIVRAGVALVPEGRRIFATLTVAENLELGATPIIGRMELDDAREQVLERFPVLRTYYQSSAGTLSGGEQQQLAIARALLGRPQLLLLDEPSLGLAPILTAQVFDALKDLRREGVTILLVEQNALKTVELADRTYVLRNGEIILSGPRSELVERTDLLTAYLGF